MFDMLGNVSNEITIYDDSETSRNIVPVCFYEQLYHSKNGQLVMFFLDVKHFEANDKL